MNISKSKREVISFNGEGRTTAISLEHLSSMSIEGTGINFSFYTNVIFVEFKSDEAVKRAFQQIINLWAAEEE